MSLLTIDWHSAWVSYEWWRDIWLPAAGAAASTVVALAALRVAIRGHRLAAQTTEFTKKLRAEEDERRKDEARREEKRQRVDFAVRARRFAEMLREGKLRNALKVDGMDPETYESYLLDIAGTLMDRRGAEYLLERMNSLFSDFKFPPIRDGEVEDPRRRDAWMTWRVVSNDIRAYVQREPLSKPHWSEHFPENPNSPVGRRV
jgi:hypothetical protein